MPSVRDIVEPPGLDPPTSRPRLKLVAFVIRSRSNIREEELFVQGTRRGKLTKNLKHRVSGDCERLELVSFVSAATFSSVEAVFVLCTK